MKVKEPMTVKELIAQYQQKIIEDKADYEREVAADLRRIAYLDTLDPNTKVRPVNWDKINEIFPESYNNLYNDELPPLTRLDDNNLDFPVQ